MILWTIYRFIRYLPCLFASVLFANVNASLCYQLMPSTFVIRHSSFIFLTFLILHDMRMHSGVFHFFLVVVLMIHSFFHSLSELLHFILLNPSFASFEVVHWRATRLYYLVLQLEDKLKILDISLVHSPFNFEVQTLLLRFFIWFVEYYCLPRGFPSKLGHPVYKIPLQFLYHSPKFPRNFL